MMYTRLRAEISTNEHRKNKNRYYWYMDLLFQYSNK